MAQMGSEWATRGPKMAAVMSPNTMLVTLALNYACHI